MCCSDLSAGQGTSKSLELQYTDIFLSLFSVGVQTAREICESETFSARCRSNEVIMMTSAQYGRMRIGRCIRADLGYLGCATDVLYLADNRCSGKRQCDIRVPDGEFDDTSPCFKELKIYMEASYTCLRGEMVSFVQYQRKYCFGNISCSTIWVIMGPLILTIVGLDY